MIHRGGRTGVHPPPYQLIFPFIKDAMPKKNIRIALLSAKSVEAPLFAKVALCFKSIEVLLGHALFESDFRRKHQEGWDLLFERLTIGPDDELAPELQFRHYTLGEVQIPVDAFVQLEGLSSDTVAVCWTLLRYRDRVQDRRFPGTDGHGGTRAGRQAHHPGPAGHH